MSLFNHTMQRLIRRSVAGVCHAATGVSYMSGVKETKFDFVTVMAGESEVIVYGDGSDWMVQYARVTNHAEGWRRWFAHRDDAEAKAREVASKPYSGRYGVNDRLTKEPAKFA